MGMSRVSLAVVAVRALPSDAVDDDPGKHERHGHEPGQMGEMLLRSEPVVVVGCGSEMDDDVERECDQPDGHSEMDEARHAADVPNDPAKHLYH
jgi:hypothetical protein